MIVPVKPLPPFSSWATSGFDHRFWRLPRNADEILSAIRDAAGTVFTVEFDGAPLTTAMELTENKGGGERVLHYVNYKVGAAVEPVGVRMAVPEGRKIARVEVLSPDRKSPEPVAFQPDGNRIRFRMPRLETYNLVVVTF